MAEFAAVAVGVEQDLSGSVDLASDSGAHRDQAERLRALGGGVAPDGGCQVVDHDDRQAESLFQEQAQWQRFAATAPDGGRGHDPAVGRDRAGEGQGERGAVVALHRPCGQCGQLLDHPVLQVGHRCAGVAVHAFGGGAVDVGDGSGVGAVAGDPQGGAADVGDGEDLLRH